MGVELRRGQRGPRIPFVRSEDRARPRWGRAPTADLPAQQPRRGDPAWSASGPRRPLSSLQAGELRSAKGGEDTSLLLDLQVPFRLRGDTLLVEAQALDGLRLWSDHFGRVTACAPVVPAHIAELNKISWLDPGPLLKTRAIRLEPLPWGYHPRDHLRERKHVAARMRSLIREHRYLCFGNFGGFGAWSNLAAAEARRMGRSYGSWFDWVVHEVAEADGQLGARRSRSLASWLKTRVESAIARVHTRRAIETCALGLFHGKSVYAAYAPYCRTPALVHDIHVKREDAIDDGALAAKIDAAGRRTSLRLGYAGRAHPMKGPLAWVDVAIQLCRELGPERVRATWVGDGPLLDEMKHRVRAAGLEERITFPGFLADRQILLDFLSELDVFLFCHLKPESPRCLLEALISGTPLVGYASEYAEDVVGARGGALFAPLHDTTQLTRHLVRLAEDRQALQDVIRAAGSSRALYNDEAVFAHRSRLIKTHLP